MVCENGLFCTATLNHLNHAGFKVMSDVSYLCKIFNENKCGLECIFVELGIIQIQFFSQSIQTSHSHKAVQPTQHILLKI